VEGLAIGLLVLVHWLGEPVRHEYEARVAALRAAGQPVRYADLATPRVPDEENAAVPFVEAATILKQRERPQALIYLEHASPEEREEARAYVDSLEPYFEALAQVPKRARWHVDHAWERGPEASFDEIGWIQDATTHLELRVQLDSDERGRTRRAADAAVLALDLGERCRTPMLLGRLVSETVTAYPARFLKTASKQPGFDAAEFRRIVDPRLARALPTGPLAVAIEEERVVVVWVVDEIRSGKRSLVDDYLPLKGLVHKSPAWRLFLYRDAIRALDLFEEAIALADKPPEEALRAAALLRRKCEASKLLFPVTRMTATFLPRLFDVYAERIARQRLTRVVMALLEHRQREGKWPGSLAPLGDLPCDPYTGKAFLYEGFMEKGVRIRAAKEVHDAWTGKRLADGDEWLRLEEDGLAWTFEE
jgi:hypothetical protein